MGETFKTVEKQSIVKKEQEKKQFLQLFDEEQIEIKCLTADEVREVVRVMQRCAFEVTEREVLHIVHYGFSFGCYVNRMLIGVGLAWPTYYDPDQRILRSGDANALYQEDPAVILAYEGRGIRRILVQAREKDAKAKQLLYSIAYVSENNPSGNLDEYIKESANQIEKLYISEGYAFYKTGRGLMAVKGLG